uniref:Uncharacterized protein n=1 Tax=Hanusia phi TaxID=3032 RepID=A0A7S0DU26_9CRYP
MRVAGKDILTIKTEDLQCLVDGPKFMPVRIEASREDAQLGPRKISLIAIVNARHEAAQTKLASSCWPSRGFPGVDYSRRYMENFTEKYSKQTLSSSPTVWSEGSVAQSAKSAAGESPRPASAPEQMLPSVETESLLQDMMKRERRRRMDAEEREQKLLDQISILRGGQHNTALDAMKREIESLKRELDEEKALRKQAEEKLNRLELKMSSTSLFSDKTHDAPATGSEAGDSRAEDIQKERGHQTTSARPHKTQSSPVHGTLGEDIGLQMSARRQQVMEQAKLLLSHLSSHRQEREAQQRDQYVHGNAYRMRLDLSQLMRSETAVSQPELSAETLTFHGKARDHGSSLNAPEQSWRDEGGIQYYSNTMHQIKTMLSPQRNQT